jgi:hypothetical protein
MTRNDFRGAFASDPAYPELAPLQTYLSLSISKNPQRVAVVTGCGSYLIQTPFLRFSALELFNWARGCVLHGRYVDQPLP